MNRDSIKSIFKRAVVEVMGVGGLFPTVAVDDEAIRALLEKLHPITPARQLIRLGPDADGGYLVPDDLDGIEACFSPGVDVVSGFEKSCAERGMRVFLADASVERPGESHENFVFTRKFVGATASDLFMTMEEWVASANLSAESDLILQIDIEGYEYETFLSMPEKLFQRFRYIIAEFHDIDKLWSEPFFRVASATFDRILKTHSCVHLHPNNERPALKKGRLALPRLLEITFARNDRIIPGSWERVFPHPLDRDNTPGPHLALPRDFYRSE
jgi:hypothetical protein